MRSRQASLAPLVEDQQNKRCEFTIGKKISQFGGKVDAVTSKEGRKETVNKLREEIKKAVKKERYLSKEDAKLINEFILKIQKELNESEN